MYGLSSGFFPVGVLTHLKCVDSKASNQKGAPAVFFRNALVIINCIVSPKTFGLQSMKAEESARKNAFSYGQFFFLFWTLCHEGGTPKGSRGRPGTALGRGVAR